MKISITKNKTVMLVLIIIFLAMAIIIGNIFINASKSNHDILLKLTENIEWTNNIGAETNKKVYISIYDGKQIKRYESNFNPNLSECLSEIEKQIDFKLNQNYVRLDITNKEYAEDSLIKMANNKNTLSYYYENGNVYNLTKYGKGKARNIENVNIKENVLIESYNYMLRQIKSDGRFIYGVNLESGKISYDYNIIRHCGSLWCLLENYTYLFENGNENYLNIMKSAYKYIYDNNIIKKDENIEFVFTDESTCKIGSNALMMLASIELYNITGEQKYIDNSNKLANGILYLQDKDGAFYHTTNKSFERKLKNKSTIYNGEIIFALIKLYEKTNNEIYLNSTLKAMDYFINNDAINTRNQWFAYYYAELVKYVKDYKYMQNFIEDMNSNLNAIAYKSNRCDMEYLGSCYNYLKKIIKNYDKYNLVDVISKDKLNSMLKNVCKTYINEAQNELSNYASIENSMFFYDINFCKGAFFEDDYFARIDISQHNLSGYRMFYEYLYDNNKLIYDNSEEIQDKSMQTNTQNINASDLNDAYVNLAKKAVETYISTGEIIAVPNNLPEEMYEKCKNGVFVGIHNKNKLRGCKGSFNPTGTIAEEVIEYAIIAATKDKRFSPIEENEFESLIYEISIISNPEKINNLNELDVKKYGIIIKKGNKRGTMLPNRKSISTVNEQIRKSLKKAGLSEDEKDYEIYRFETTNYKGQ